MADRQDRFKPKACSTSCMLRMWSSMMTVKQLALAVWSCSPSLARDGGPFGERWAMRSRGAYRSRGQQVGDAIERVDKVDQRPMMTPVGGRVNVVA